MACEVVCLDAAGARDIACRPWAGALPIAAHTATLRIGVPYAGDSERSSFEFAGPVVILGLLATAGFIKDDATDAPESFGDIAPRLPALLAKLDANHGAKIITKGARHAAPFAPLAHLCLPLRGLGLVLPESAPELGIILRSGLGATQEAWGKTIAHVSILYRPIGWVE